MVKTNVSAVRGGQKIDFTQAQGEAIVSRGADLLVSASAGSGKTTVMVERIASMIAGGECTFKDLLVLTFTNASAVDMRAKLRRRLENMKINTENLNEATIGTFHKFCGEVIRTYFNIVGVSPDFSVMDEIAAMSLKTEVLADVITRMYEKCTQAIETFCVNRKTEMFQKMLIRIYEFLASRGDANAWLDSTAMAAYETDIAMRAILDYYAQAGRYYLGKFSQFEPTRFCDECRVQAQQLAEIKNYNDLRSLALTWNFTRLSKCDDGDFKRMRERFKELLKKLEPYRMPEEDMLANGKRDCEIIKQVIQISREFDMAYSAAKSVVNKMDFNDLEKYMCIILENAEIAAALRNRYKYIFIDEYQDTNPMQERILASVAGENNKIFMVGDVKQSIYGFRGCEATIFAGKMTDFEKTLSGKVVCLNENFRSRENILCFANLVFGKVMKQATADIDYNTTSRLVGSRSDGAVDVTLINTSSGTAAELQAAVVAQKIAELQAQDISLGDIAILSRSRTHFTVLAETLERAGIAVNVAAEQNACELFEVATLNNMLFAVSNFYNDVPLVLTMQSFVFGFIPDELAELKLAGGEDIFFKNLLKSKAPKVQSFVKFLEKYRELAKTNSVVDVLTVFLTEYKITERLSLLPQGMRMVGNIHAYLNKLRNAPYAVSAAEFLYLLESELIEIKISPPATNGEAVQIITMHSSKGLEFPNVIIFDVGAAFNLNDTRQLMVIDKNCGLCVYTLDADEFTKTMSIARLGAAISARRVMVAEEMRLLYVALTRARERLIIVGGGNLDKIGSGSEDYDIVSAKNFLHFLGPTLFDPVRDPCFDLTVVECDDVQIAKKDLGVRVLSGQYDKKLAEELRALYAKPYPYKQARLKNSVSSLTFIEEEVRVKGHGEAGTQYGTQFHKEMQHLELDELEKLIPEIKGYDIHREIVFLQSVGDIIVQGVIDLLAIKDGHAIIVDYKTTRAVPEKLIELYKPQLEMYAGAVRQAFDSKQICIYIYSTFNKKLVKI